MPREGGESLAAVHERPNDRPEKNEMVRLLNYRSFNNRGPGGNDECA
jgi:hypothetical protein